MKLGCQIIRYLSFVVLLLSFIDVSYSQDAKSLERTINSELRKAQNLSFSGKNSESLEILNSVDNTLKQLKNVDPGNNQIKSFEQKLAKQKQDLEKKSKSSSSSTSKSATTASVGTTTDSSDIKGPALIALNGMIGHLDRAEKTMEAGTGDLGEGSLKRAEQRYQEIQTRHSQIASHQDVVSAKERYDALVTKMKQAEIARAKQKEDEEVNSKKQSKMIAENEKIIESYISVSGAKYLRDNPKYISEAQTFLEDYDAVDFPLGKPMELEGSIKSLKREIEASAKAKAASGVEGEWMPKFKPFITHGNSSYVTLIAQHELSDKNRVSQMSDNVVNAKKLIADYDKAFPDGVSTYSVQKAADDLKGAINRYQESIGRNSEDLLSAIRRDLDFEAALFEKNDSWNEKSPNPIHILNRITNTRLAENISMLKNNPGADAGELKKIESDFAIIIELDKKWRERLTAWENAPKPFPVAGMTSSSLMSDIEKILKDRGVWPVESVVITDKDWWVQKNEYRYVRTAVKQKDKDGDFFRYVMFRQLWSASGYGRTEYWLRPDLEDKKIRIAK
jgi:hypothetical protein